MSVSEILRTELIRRKNNNEIPLIYGRRNYNFGDKYDYEFNMTPFNDKKGLRIFTSFLCITHDRYIRKWYGIILKNKDIDKIVFHSNYDTWINDQDYAKELEIVGIHTADNYTKIPDE